jgi:hypothetical protein
VLLQPRMYMLHVIADGQLRRTFPGHPASAAAGPAPPAPGIAKAVRVPVRRREAVATVPVVGR